MHPYASEGAGPDLRARKMYGIDEEVWLAHHYGIETKRKAWMPPSHYGAHIVEERIQQEQERIRQRQLHYRLNSTAGYFLRREERMKQRAKEERERRTKEGKNEDQLAGEHECVIS